MQDDFVEIEVSRHKYDEIESLCFEGDAYASYGSRSFTIAGLCLPDLQDENEEAQQVADIAKNSKDVENHFCDRRMLFQSSTKRPSSKPVHPENMKKKANNQLLLPSFDRPASALSSTTVELLFNPEEERDKSGGVDCFFPPPFSDAVENRKEVRFVYPSFIPPNLTTVVFDREFDLLSVFMIPEGSVFGVFEMLYG